MALPAIFRRLFRDNGYSSLLKPEIIPFTTDASSNATNVAASTSWVRTATNGYINGLSISGKTITYTKGNGTTGTLTTQDTTYSVATQSNNGLMSAADKQKLNGISAGAGKYTLVATYNSSGNKTITGCTVGQLLLFLYKMGKGSTGGDTGGWIKVVSGADAGQVPSGGHFWLGTDDGVERRSTNIFATVPTSTTVVVNLADIGDDPTKDIIYVYR